MWRWMRVVLLLGIALVAVSGWLSGGSPATSPRPADASRPERSTAPAAAHANLPAEALETLSAIERGGPFPHDRDGSVFQNREGLLPQRVRGYYREYTVPTPGAADRGARRIVSGGQPPEVYYYTADHYRTFQRIEVPR
jgi:ribonuclease T1